MPQDVFNPPRLKLVMLFNVRNQTYCVCSHNLTAEEASQELDRLRRDGRPAFTRSRHKAEEAAGCGDCRADVEHAIEAVPGHSKPEPGSPKRQL